MNLVETILGYCGGDAVGKISSLLGEDQNRTRSAVTAAVPTLLASLAGTASNADGARKLFTALGDVDDSLLGNIGSMFGPKSNSIMDKGSGLLTTILGGAALSKVAGAISKFTGIGNASIMSLLGLLTPLVLGVLKKQKATSGLDASGLANLLSGQSNNIASAIPSGLGGLLGDIPGLSQFTNMAKGWDSKSVPQRTTTPSRTPVGAAPHSSGSLFRWLVPLVLLAVGAWLLYSWLNNRSTTPTVPGQNPPVVTTDRPLPTTDLVASLTSNVKDVFTNASNTLSSITDAASAKAALPKIEEFTSKLGSLESVFAGLDSSQKTAITKLVGTLKGNLQTALDKIMAIPGVSDAIKPAVDALMEQIDAFTA